MARTSLLFIVGAAAGAAVAYGGLKAGAGSEPPRTETPSLTDFPSPDVADAAAPADVTGSGTTGTTGASGYASARLAAYEAAAAADDAFDLETLIDVAARSPDSRRRDMQLTALLARLTELEPRRAVDIAQTLRLGTRFLVPVFEAWTAADADAAIAGLENVVEPAALRALALSVLRTLGDDARNIDRVANALPRSDRLAFAIDAIADRAGRDPRGALAAAAALKTDVGRTLAAQKVAERGADVDPQAALAAADSISDPNVRSAYTNAVLSRWARTDPLAVLAYIETAPPGEIPSNTAILTIVAASDPERVLAMLERLPPGTRGVVQRSALQAIAARDPLDALTRLAAMPPGQDRTSAMQSIAQAYGRQNPEAALAWAKALTPPSREALSGVLRGIAEVDFDRALDLLVAELDSAPNDPSLTLTLPTSILLPLVSPIGGNDRDFARVADRLASVTNPRVRSLMSTTLSRWSQTDLEGALAWAVANVDRLDPAALSSLAGQASTVNAALAASTADRLPPGHRAAWISGAANGIAQTDPTAALRFIDPLRGQPEYDQALGGIVSRLAQEDPESAARLLASASPSPQLNAAATTVARLWAGRDPAAAARFVLTLPDARMQANAVRNVVTAWARSDEAAAEQWVSSLPSGEMRDNALNAYMSAAAAAGNFDARLLASFSNDRARESAAGSAIAQIGRTNLPEARRLLELHVTDPNMRRVMEEQLARTGGIGDSSAVPSALLDAITTIQVR